jgi:predicted TIM-barrel fold metal-dependent hydrolase
MLPSWIEGIRRLDPQGRAIIEGLPVPAWTPELAIETMDANGIEAMVLSNPIGTKGFTSAEGILLASRMNDEMAAILVAHPKRFGARGTSIGRHRCQPCRT